MTRKPTTLGETLALNDGAIHMGTTAAWAWQVLLTCLNLIVLACISALVVLWVAAPPGLNAVAIWLPLLLLGIFWWYLNRKRRRKTPHFLLSNDRQRFVSQLRLDAKTAVIDGSNIYHFGHQHGLDAQPLGEIADQLRGQGYRIVCFFDANIFHTLSEHGAFSRGKTHSVSMLRHIFGLHVDEIYVVPSGVQADIFVLECLKHLPISFAVTNDRFRDYADQYPTVMRDNLWRKGVGMSAGKPELLGHQKGSQ